MRGGRFCDFGDLIFVSKYLLSFSPGFSPVLAAEKMVNRFNGLHDASLVRVEAAIRDVGIRKTVETVGQLSGSLAPG